MEPARLQIPPPKGLNGTCAVKSRAFQRFVATLTMCEDRSIEIRAFWLCGVAQFGHIYFKRWVHLCADHGVFMVSVD